MNIKIKYNEKIDEFTNDLSIETRIKKYIYNHFYPAYAISSLAPIFLLGGSIRDLIFAKYPKDLDFVVLGSDNLEWVLDVLKKFEIEYEINRLGGFKFTYNNTKIDLWISDDLFSSIEYNVDGLFYDVKNNKMISLTFDDFIKNGLKKVNEENNIEKDRVKKLIKFANNYKEL